MKKTWIWIIGAVICSIVICSKYKKAVLVREVDEERIVLRPSQPDLKLA